MVVILFWLLVWQFASSMMNQKILLPSPYEVLQSLLELVKTGAFLEPLFSSAKKIMIGFFLAFLLGSILAAMSYRFSFVKELCMPPMKVIKATPVASFVILALIWVGSVKLSVLISFLMVLPMIYTNLYQGLTQTDSKMLEMAKVYHMKWYRKVYAIYLPATFPYIESACAIGVGFCFKAGIAAEVIGIPSGSIGQKLYEAKLYLMTKELFAWTILIILISVFIEKLMVGLLHLIRRVFF